MGTSRRLVTLLLYAFLLNGVGGTAYERLDGWYNNLAHPDWGTPGTRLLRKVPAAYSDGVYQPSGADWPNPRFISETALKGVSGLPSHKNRTVFWALFGQFVSLESIKASGAGCPRELTPVAIPKCDAQYDRGCTGTKKTPFLRAPYDKKSGHSPGSPREQMNGASAFIDGSVIYSNSKVWNNAMRTFVNGTMKSRDGDGLWPVLNTPSVPLANPPPAREHVLMAPERQWLLGDPRLFQHPAMLAFGVLFFRYHNKLAQELAAQNPAWDDETIFQEARKWVIATQQNIYAYEFFPAFTNTDLPAYSGYKEHVYPAVSHIFQSAAFRFGHSVVPPGFYRRDAQCNFFNTTTNTTNPGYPAVRMCNIWWHGDEPFEFGLEPVLLGMASQITEREDHILVDDVRENLKTAYNDKIDKMDIFVAGLYESQPDRPLGELFLAVVTDHFTRIRDGDRFWFENTQNGLFNSSEIEQLKNTTLYDVILKVTNIQPGEIQRNVFFWNDGDPCPQPKQLNISDMAQCNDNLTHDFFTGSEVVYILVIILIGLLPFCFAGLVIALHACKKIQNRRNQTSLKNNKVAVQLDDSIEEGENIIATQWRGSNSPMTVAIELHKGLVKVKDPVTGKTYRTVDVVKNGAVISKISNENGGRVICLHFPKEYDVVLQFSDEQKRERLSAMMTTFLKECNVKEEVEFLPLQQLYAEAETKERRKIKVEKFLHHVFAQVYSKDDNKQKQTNNADLKNIFDLEMSREEFAEAMVLKPDSMFVDQMFNMVDKDGNGYISFREFLDVLVLLSKGSEDDKMRLMFDMYDLDGGGTMDRGEFTALLRSMIEMTDSSLSEEEINVLLEGMFAAGGFENKEELTFEDFKTMLTQEKDVVNLSGGQLKSEIAKKEAASRPASAVSRPRSAEKLKVETDTANAPTGAKKHFMTFQKFVENNFLHIFYLALFFLITIAIFVERSYYYAVLNEAKGLRRMAGYGISVTRGAVSSMSFTFSVVLLTMCKNTMNLLRTTWVNNYVPFDAAFGFHKVSAYTSTFIALGHTIGHCINFYHLSTQPPDFVGCVFSNTIWFRSDYLPTFGFYLFQTVTGLTGVVLVVLLTLMIVFATPWARKKVYTAFWTVHNLYVLLYALIILHGSAVLVQDPWFYYFYLGPMLLFALDKLVSISNKSVPVTVLKAEHLPSNVTHITLRKPRTFKNKSGQWARIAIVGHGDNEYHPFTITAAEHEDVIAFHIRAVGPWTTQLRQLMDPERLREGPYPKMYIDGPFGGVSEDWSKYEVAILVGGGIGVTPFAAILKHVSYLASIKAKINCKKIYFFWVTQNQRQFEWMIDIIREVEESDFDDLVTVNVFVTQFFGKFDLRTVMMFLCEKHFVSISERSLFTGLKAPTNFGRPDFQKVIRDISLQWPKVHKFGVFACGPPALTNSVSAACSHVNKTSSASFSFYEENF